MDSEYAYGGVFFRASLVMFIAYMVISNTGPKPPPARLSFVPPKMRLRMPAVPIEGCACHQIYRAIKEADRRRQEDLRPIIITNPNPVFSRPAPVPYRPRSQSVPDIILDMYFKDTFTG